jgi:ring-1,2-phenylacetyl-CoA epoxidase subunit PaaB
MRSGSLRAAPLTPRALGFATPQSPMPKSSACVRRARLPNHQGTRMDDSHHWPLYEVFVRARGGLDHKHVGSLHAADERMAIEHARDLYTRRQEGVSIWVVPSKAITASDPGETESLFEPARDKIYRHPTFYDIPDEVKTL